HLDSGSPRPMPARRKPSRPPVRPMFRIVSPRPSPGCHATAGDAFVRGARLLAACSRARDGCSTRKLRLRRDLPRNARIQLPVCATEAEMSETIAGSGAQPIPDFRDADGLVAEHFLAAVREA